MNIETYIEECRAQRKNLSFSFLAERCESSPEAPYRIRPAAPVRADETLVLALPGKGNDHIFLRGYNGFLRDVDDFIKNEPELANQPIRVCVAVTDFGDLHDDKLARKGLYYEKIQQKQYIDFIHGVPLEARSEVFNPAYVQDIFDVAVLPRLAKEGKRLPQQQALQNIRRLNILTHCHGGYMAMQLEKIMDATMANLGYSDKEQQQLKSQLVVLAYNPDCPKAVSELRFISIESSQDWHNDYQNYVREWLLMEPKDFGVCYLDKRWGRTLMCTQFDKSGIEGNPPKVLKAIEVGDDFDFFKLKNADADQPREIAEHDFLGFDQTENMSKGARRLQKFASNILKNSVKNSLQQTGDTFVPLPKIQDLAADNVYEKLKFAQAAITGFRLSQQMILCDKRKIDNHAAWRRSIPTVELD